MERWLDCHCIQLPQTADSGSATDHSRVHGGSSLSRRPCRRKLSGSVEHVVVDPGVHPLAKSRPIYLENCLPAAPSNPQFRLRILLARWASAEARCEWNLAGSSLRGSGRQGLGTVGGNQEARIFLSKSLPRRADQLQFGAKLLDA